MASDEYLVKITLIGSSEESKQKFLSIYTESMFHEDHFSTLGVDINTKKITIYDYNVKLILVRLSSLETFYRTRPSYYQGASTSIILFDKNNRASFNDVPKWYEEFRRHTRSPHLPIAIIGITSDSEEVSTEEAQALAGQFPNCTYFDCTLKNKKELDVVIEHLVREFLNLDHQSDIFDLSPSIQEGNYAKADLRELHKLDLFEYDEVAGEISVAKEMLRGKIVLIGDGGVGKTTFRRAWLDEGSKTQYLMTIGADFVSKEINFYYAPTKTSYTIKFQIWDLAGQPRFKAVPNLYYRGAVGALCFFNITNQESYTNLVEWIKNYWDFNGQGRLPLIIVGTKCDLRGNPVFPNQVASKHGLQYAAELTKLVKEKNGFEIHYIETSAKDQINVDETFLLLANEIINSSKFSQKEKRRQGIEPPPTPFIYYFPYPKSPPAASAATIPIIFNVCPHCGESNEQRKPSCPTCGADLTPPV